MEKEQHKNNRKIHIDFLSVIYTKIAGKMGRRRELELRKKHAVQTVAAMLGMIGFVLFVMDTEKRNQTATKLERNCEGMDWTHFEIGDLNRDQMQKYLEWTNSSSCRQPHHIGGHVNVDGVDGQWTVCMDPQTRPNKEGDCLVYSFGIVNNDWTFEEAMEKLECDVYVFEKSIKSMNHSNKLHLYNVELIEMDERRSRDANRTARSFDSIYHDLLRHGERIIDYVKIDIKKADRIALSQLISTGVLDRVRQLGVKINFPKFDTLGEFKERIKIVKSLEDYGMVRFNSKHDPWIHADIPAWKHYLAYEITWYNSRLLRSESRTQDQPIHVHSNARKKKLHNPINIKNSKYRLYT